MPALYIPPLPDFDSLLAQLENLRAVAPEQLDSVLQTHQCMTLLQLTALALKNPVVQQHIDATYRHIRRTQPARLERQQLSVWQQEIKARPSLRQQGLDLANSLDFTGLLQQRLKQQSRYSPLEKIRRDAYVLHQMLTPSVQITQHADTITESAYSLTEFRHNPPDMIFILGNNDLRQIDHIAALYHQARQRPPLVYVSGFGGHGTMHDPVFAHQEGETMRQRLCDHGVPAAQIRVEYDAVDTGRNVKYMDTFLLLEYACRQDRFCDNDKTFLQHCLALPAKAKRTPDEEARLDALLAPLRQDFNAQQTVLFQHILVSGTPGGLRRQLSTVEKQKTLPWKTLSCLAPAEFQTPFSDSHYYYGSLHHALINLLYALREVASYLDYTVNSAFISNRPLADTDNLRQCLMLYANYYNLMQEPKYSLTRQCFFREKRVNGAVLAEQFLQFSEQKGHHAPDPELATRLNSMIKPTSQYFRRVFLDVETGQLKQLRQTSSLREQASQLEPQNTLREATFRCG